jgi:hypothetical protein
LSQPSTRGFHTSLGFPSTTRLEADNISKLNSSARLNNIPARPSSPNYPYLHPSQVASTTGRTSSPLKSSADIPNKGICRAFPADPDNRMGACTIGKQRAAEQDSLRAPLQKPVPPEFLSSLASAAEPTPALASASWQQENGNWPTSSNLN